MQTELQYELLRILEGRPDISQRELSRELGVSLGKTNYCLKALIEKGLIKAKNFRNSDNKSAYLYLLTPRGIEEKGRTAVRFLRDRLEEFDKLSQEIERLRSEVRLHDEASDPLLEKFDEE